MNQKHIIEKGIPIPEKHRPRHPLHTMEVGDSFITNPNGIVGAYQLAKKLGMKVTARKQPDGSRRVWRTE